MRHDLASNGVALESNEPGCDIFGRCSRCGQPVLTFGCPNLACREQRIAMATTIGPIATAPLDCGLKTGG